MSNMIAIALSLLLLAVAVSLLPDTMSPLRKVLAALLFGVSNYLFMLGWKGLWS